MCAISDNSPAIVADLMCAATQTWDDDILKQNLLPMDIEIIRQIPIGHVAQEDCWAWHYDKSGTFTIRSVYWMLVDTKSRHEVWLNGDSASSENELQEQNWKRLVKIKVPPNCICMAACPFFIAYE